MNQPHSHARDSAARSLILAAALLAPATATADPAVSAGQAQADLGLSVVGLGYERTVADHVAVSGEAGIFGTYFLPWFDRGDDVAGVMVGARATWFARADHRGLYVAPYLRGVAVRGDSATGTADGTGVTAGAFAGWAFGLSRRVDLRIGAGAQYIYVDAAPLGASTPFVALDAVVGYRM